MKCDEMIGMLDAFVDGELDGEARDGILQHARVCEDCARELKSAEMLKEALDGIDREVVVPLAAQAAWRSVVKGEARKGRMRGLYRKLGAVAAACVVLVGVAAGLNLLGTTPIEAPAAKVASDGGQNVGTFVFVEPDGDESLSTIQMTPRTSEAADITATVRITAEDVEAAVETVKSLVGEFNGYIGESSVTTSTAYIMAYVPAGELGAFTDSMAYAGTVESARVDGESGDMASVTITIQTN